MAIVLLLNVLVYKWRFLLDGRPLFLEIYSMMYIRPQLLLRKKAAEELKKEQERKSAERRKIIDQRCGDAKNLEGANEGT